MRLVWSGLGAAVLIAAAVAQQGAAILGVRWG